MAITPSDKPQSKSQSVQSGFAVDANSQRFPHRAVWGYSALACFFYWLSLPPCSQPWAAYVSAFFFAALVGLPFPFSRRDYVRIWIVSCVTWLALLQGIRLAFWPLYLGWIALSLYVAVYIPLAIVISRWLVYKTNAAIPFSIAVAWTATELGRAYVLTGFSACMLGHSQTPWPHMLPIAAMFGAYGVSFMVMLTGATLGAIVITLLRNRWYANQTGDNTAKPFESWSNIIALLFCVSWIFWSMWSLNSYDRRLSSNAPIKPLGKFLLIQSNMPTMFDVSQTQLAESWIRYAELTQQGIIENREAKLDAILWPESAYGVGASWMEWDGKSVLSPEMSLDETRERKKEFDESYVEQANSLFRSLGPNPPPLIAGGGVITVRESGVRVLNAALLVAPNESQPEYYGKRHLVMFGEYIPILYHFPNLQAAFGIGPTGAGERFECWRLASGTYVAPSVCFEDVVPHFIQNQVHELEQQNRSPDLLVNLTNDAWFRGSSILDHHLNNAILVAVENRRPVLIAANSGITAWIDGSGRVQKRLDRFEEGFFIAEPIPDGRKGLWQTSGDRPVKWILLLYLSRGLLPLIAWAIARRNNSL
ncbi:MAG: apolipoprotein N-acyltransferase [Pirellula sp.]|nr:apolipoprotein N-acyltransferase [Pirellula sp.]